MDFIPEKKFDKKLKRYYMDSEQMVFHCHHYTTLLTQLAMDAKRFNGEGILFNSSKKSFYTVFIDYFKKYNIVSQEDKVRIIEQYFSHIGLGILKINIDKKTAHMDSSHLDEGWKMKWGTYDKPVNMIGQGYIAAAFSAIIGADVFKVEEIQSIACGADCSKFTIEYREESNGY